MMKLSLIIPVFNAAAHIGACLDSVLAQTLDQLEVILVDDHGSDDSMTYARARLAAYEGPKRFVFCQTAVNSGPGAARNLGMEKATGTYIGFLDSDDTLDPEFCASLFDAACSAGADLAFGHIVFDGPGGKQLVRRNPPVPAGAFEGAVKRKYLRRFTSYFTTYIYRRAMLLENGICFPGTRSAEDSCFLICSLLAARRIASVDRALYHYNLYPESISRKRDPQRWKQRLESFRMMEAFARRSGLYTRYRGVIRLMILKKGWLMAFKDYVTDNLRK